MDCRERKRGMSQNLEQGHVRRIRARFHHPFFSSSLLSRLSLLTTHFVSPDSLFATRNGLSNEYPIKSGETRGDVAPNHHQSKDVASKSPPIEGQLRIVNPTPQQVCSLIVYPTLNGICDHFYSVTIMEAEARAEFVCQVQSPAKASSRSFSENDGEMHSRISTQCQVLRSTDQLTAVVDVGEGDAMLEVGLGTGSLTNVLINAGAFVLAIKKDPYMATHVSERFAETDRLKNMNCQGSTLEKVIWVAVVKMGICLTRRSVPHIPLLRNVFGVVDATK
ncbi:hypothetical protein ACFX13_040341 [Malus domestica]